MNRNYLHYFKYFHKFNFDNFTKGYFVKSRKSIIIICLNKFFHNIFKIILNNQPEICSFYQTNKEFIYQKNLNLQISFLYQKCSFSTLNTSLFFTIPIYYQTQTNIINKCVRDIYLEYLHFTIKIKHKNKIFEAIFDKHQIVKINYKNLSKIFDVCKYNLKFYIDLNDVYFYKIAYKYFYIIFKELNNDIFIQLLP